MVGGVPSQAVRASLADDELVGRRIGGRYRVLGMLGRGGMGRVLRVEDDSTGRLLALKQATERKNDDDERERAQLRFRREFHSLARLRHPRIVQVFEFGLDDSGAFYTMELLDGVDLKEAGRLDWREACRVLRDVAGALAFLHARGLLHRDLAPRNIRYTADGRAKLIDFGLLASVGVSTEIAGTPAFIAPENLRGLPLDGRTDLYALGALGYWVSTGRHPYPARALGELERLWRQSPPPPSEIVDDVPPAFDELIASLLCLDPLGRPASAAEVIDRLQATADLPADPDIAVTEGYLASATMVGRRREIEVLRGCVSEAAQGHGRSVLVEAASGTGKSRLLRELGLEAQLAGARVLSASGNDGRRGSYGVLHQLVRAATEVAPEAIRELDRDHASVVARVFPDLRARLGEVRVVHPVAEPAEERMRIQRSLTRWLLELTTVLPVTVLVDDVQRCDEASAAVLASLARYAPAYGLLLTCALRTGEMVRAPAAIEALGGADLRLRLSGLALEEIEVLVRSLFGDVPHTTRLARWMHQRTGGSPLHCTELARMLVETDVIRYVDGVWVLPMDVAADAAPPELTRAMDERIATLGEDAREVAAVLAVVGGRIELATCRALTADTLDEPALFAALDELVAQSVLVSDGDGFEFRHDGLREAVLRGLDGEKERSLHRCVGEFLAAAGLDETHEAEIGWHLHRGGDETRGAGYLERAGKRMFAVQALSDCIAPLETALATLEQAEVPRARLLELRFMLVAAGWISDRRAGLRHMMPAIEAYRAHAGIDTAERLGRFVGLHLGFLLGLAWTMLRWIATPRSRRGPSPIDAMSTFAVTVGYACGLLYANHDLEGLHHMIDVVRPMGVMRGRMPHAAYVGIRAFPDLLMGRLGPARHKLDYVLETLQRDRLTPMGEFERRFSEAGIHSLIAQIQIANLDLEVDETIEAMRRLDLRYYDLVAETTRAVTLRFRGEEREARAVEAELEAVSLQLGSWSTDVQLVLFGHPPHGMFGDIVALKRMVDALERLVNEGFDYRARLAMTRGELHRARGEYDEACEAFEQAIELLHAEERLTRQWILSGLAEARLAAGDAEAAETRALAALRHAEDPDEGQQCVRLRASRVLALAEAALGRPHPAISRLDETVRLAEEVRSPAAAGLAHEARARIALAQGDTATYRLHSERAAAHLRPTGNAALIGILERLLDAGAHKAAVSGEAAEAADTTTTVTNAPASVSTAASLQSTRNTLP
jgi:tetratricopeptide (TPR) repeat protein